MIAHARHQLRHCLTLALLLVSSLLALTPEAAAQGRKSRTLQRLEQERKQLLRSIEASDKKLQQLRRDTRNEEQTLRTVKEQVEQRRQVVAVLGNEVSGLQARIDTLSGHIGRLHRREGALLLRYRAALVQLQRIDTHIDPVLFVLSSQNPAEARERQRFLSRYSKAVREASVALRTTRTEIEATKAEVGRTHSEKEQLLSLREAEKKKLEAEEQQRAAQVKDLQGKQQVLAQDLSKQKQKAEDLDRKIQAQVEAEIVAAQRRAAELQRRREEARRRRQTQRTQPTPPPSTGRSAEVRGRHPHLPRHLLLMMSPKSAVQRPQGAMRWMPMSVRSPHPLRRTRAVSQPLSVARTRSSAPSACISIVSTTEYRSIVVGWTSGSMEIAVPTPSSRASSAVSSSSQATALPSSSATGTTSPSTPTSVASPSLRALASPQARPSALSVLRLTAPRVASCTSSFGTSVPSSIPSHGSKGNRYYRGF